MNGGTRTEPLAVDALADELLVAVRDHPANLLSAEMFALDGGKLQAAYNRLYCELHDEPRDESGYPGLSGLPRRKA